MLRYAEAPYYGLRRFDEKNRLCSVALVSNSIKLHCIRLHCLRGRLCKYWFGFCAMLLHGSLDRDVMLLFLRCRSNHANLAWHFLRSKFDCSSLAWYIFASMHSLRGFHELEKGAARFGWGGHAPGLFAGSWLTRSAQMSDQKNTYIFWKPFH